LNLLCIVKNKKNSKIIEIYRLRMDRRDFIKKTLPAAAIGIGSVGIGLLFHNREVKKETKVEEAKILNFSVPDNASFPKMVIANGHDHSKLVESAINELGGIKRFINSNDVVLIKPNIGWDRVPEQAANTNPEVVKAIVSLCLTAGAKKVFVTDISCNDYMRCFSRSGIKDAVESVGGIVELPNDTKFKDINMGGDVLGVRKVYSLYLEATKIINVPIVKHHSLTGATLGMKNWYGILGGRRNQLHQHINESLADLANFIRPSLIVMDATRVLMKNGPQGGNLSDVMEANMIIAGTDQVAIDAYAGERFFNLGFQQLGFLDLAHNKGIGNKNYSELSPKEINI
jgi:uncharacterized protein (DUF362 family)